jgi:hypothetical protein
MIYQRPKVLKNPRGKLPGDVGKTKIYGVNTTSRYRVKDSDMIRGT